MISKKQKSAKNLLKLGFDEALARAIRTNPAELAEVHERVAKDAGEIERDAKQHFEDIRAGGRSFKRSFRP